jgi:hypothetical protein
LAIINKINDQKNLIEENLRLIRQNSNKNKYEEYLKIKKNLTNKISYLVNVIHKLKNKIKDYKNEAN